MSATAKKGALGLGIVKKKNALVKPKASAEKSPALSSTPSASATSTNVTAATSSTPSTSSAAGSETKKPLGLSLLGDYSDSDESE